MPQNHPRRALVLLAGFVVLLVMASASHAATPPPNIVLIVADDLGYGDVGCYGNQEASTPGIDALAAAGARFTSGYVACPVCSPSRVALLSGRYPTRFGYEFNPSGDVSQIPSNFGVPSSVALLPEFLKAAGYATGLVGKWHLGWHPNQFPLDRGFDEFFGFLNGSHGYYPATSESNNPIYRQRKEVVEKDYLTDAFTREAISFIQRHAGSPFFLEVAYNACHTPPDEPPAKYMKRVPQKLTGVRRITVGQIVALDNGINRLLQAISNEGLDNTTLVMFLSDNGGAHSVNEPLRAGKGSVHEGGIRIPMAIQFKGHIPRGQVLDQPVISMDLTATAMSAAGLPVPAVFDGEDLAPLLVGQNASPPDEALFWRYGRQWAIRQGAWKLVQPLQGGVQLFNLDNDPGEDNDLLAAKPAIARQLRSAWDQWNSGNTPPRWPPPPGSNAG